MIKLLIILALAVFLYSPYGPSWGRTVVNIAILIGLFSFLGKNIPKRRPYDEEEGE